MGNELVAADLIIAIGVDLGKPRRAQRVDLGLGDPAIAIGIEGFERHPLASEAVMALRMNRARGGGQHDKGNKGGSHHGSSPFSHIGVWQFARLLILKRGSRPIPSQLSKNNRDIPPQGLSATFPSPRHPLLRGQRTPVGILQDVSAP
jgi:hypothetical protein